MTIRGDYRNIKLSIVTTLFNSSPYVEEFCKRICAEAERITSDFEVILVDDGSPDDSLNVALRLLSSNSKLKVIELSRNFGHHKAMMTGLEHAAGETVFLIDVDLDEQLEFLGEFYRKLCIGIVGLYISRIFVETKMRPYTLVREIHGARVPEVIVGR